MSETLGDLGERRLVRELLWERYGRSNSSFGDDCAPLLTTPVGTVVATTDPAPRPVAHDLGMSDPYHWGWLLAAINLSDLAAAAATPLGLLTSITTPSATLVKDFERLLDGVDDCCAASGAFVVGGNIKEAVDGQTHCEATAIGLVEGGRPTRRSGARSGDVIVAFGPSGGFWAALLVHVSQGKLEPDVDKELLDALLRPRPQVAVARALRTAGLTRAATDASDGLYAAVAALTLEQGLGCLLGETWDYPAFVSDAARRLAVDPLRLALGFGDLQLVCALNPDGLPDALRIAEADGVHVTVLGTVVQEPRVDMLRNERRFEMANFDNERFTEESEFTAGLNAYRERLLNRPLECG